MIEYRIIRTIQLTRTASSVSSSPKNHFKYFLFFMD